ncbi:IS30 family transposase [Candidatus Babeliales bacterium]|nr:IS30 family transposase [Candidatus Babeliales bacterium]
MAYKQLTYDQRCQIKTLLQANHSVPYISRALKIHKSTVYRELKRNRGKRGYRHKQANLMALRRRATRAFPYKLSHELLSFIKKKLTNDQWSPEQISGYLKRENITQISPKTIYSYIWQGLQTRNYQRQDFDR